jgi:hypothetical protein
MAVIVMIIVSLGVLAELRKETVGFMSVRTFVRMEQLGSHWTDFYEIYYLNVFRSTVDKFQVPLKSDKMTSTLHEDQYTFLIMSRPVFLRMRNTSGICRGNQNTYYVFSNDFSKILPFVR